jgi:hypothetical protein
MRPLAFGEWVERGGRWRVVMSRPDPWRPGYRWRDGQCYTAPELVDPAEEERVRRAPLPPEPDCLPRVGDYIVVRAQP